MFTNSAQDNTIISGTKLADVHSFDWAAAFRKLYQVLKNSSLFRPGRKGVQFYAGLEDEFSSQKQN